MQRIFPILEHLQKYKVTTFKKDVFAGLTVGVMLVPQGMAYALLAGVPPIYGLYASIIPLFLYAILGSSRFLSVGPVALVSLLVLAGVSQLAELESERYIQLTLLTAFLAGIFQILLGVFKLGKLINFLSYPVIGGFTSAAALIIAFSQLKNLVGLDLPRSNYIYEIVIQTAQKIGEINWPTLILGVGGIFLLLVLKKINRSMPGALIVVLLGSILAWGFQLEDAGVDLVKEVPASLPIFSIPHLSRQDIITLLPLSGTIALISFIESMAISKTLESPEKAQQINPNKELIALGIAKVGGAFFQSIPTSGSFSRSAINYETDAQTGIGSIITVVLIAITLLFLTPFFYFLPKAILAAIIFVAIIGLVDLPQARKLWKEDRRDFFMLLATFLSTLLLGIQEGILIGVALSLMLMVYRNSEPHIAVLGHLPNSSHYRNLTRFPEAEQSKDLLIMRFDAQLYFGNADYFRETIQKFVEGKGKELKAFVLDASTIHDIDSSGIRVLDSIIDFFNNRKILFFVAGAIGPVRDIIYRSGTMEKLGKENQFMYVHDAVTYYLSLNKDQREGWSSNALQTNLLKSSPKRSS